SQGTILGIRSLIEFGNLVGPLAHSVLYLRGSTLRLARKRFRGEPAISEFDWLFTPIHSSSQAFSTTTWFGPPPRVNEASPWPWIDHPVSGQSTATVSPYSDSLSLRLRAKSP